MDTKIKAPRSTRTEMALSSTNSAWPEAAPSSALSTPPLAQPGPAPTPTQHMLQKYDFGSYLLNDRLNVCVSGCGLDRARERGAGTVALAGGRGTCCRRAGHPVKIHCERQTETHCCQQLRAAEESDGNAGLRAITRTNHGGKKNRSKPQMLLGEAEEARVVLQGQGLCLSSASNTPGGPRGQLQG